MQTLEPISIPLNQASLIEASAGTGKTYTMANLYLRLVLGVGCEPLMAEQILVVTFTKAATQELRDRIRARLKEVAKHFAAPESEEAQQFFADPFFGALYQAVQPRLHEALLRLRIAEQEMDLATIFTIDSFCQKMLFQYAFDSGVRFDIDLQTDESELLRRLSEETWRELFYPASLAESELVAQYLVSPAKALDKVKGYLSGIFPAPSEAQQAWLATDFAEQAVRFSQFLAKAKAYWQEHSEDIVAPIMEICEKQSSDEKFKVLNAKSYNLKTLNEKLTVINSWAYSNALGFPKDELTRFSQTYIEKSTNAAAKKKDQVPTSPHFAQWDEFLAQFAEFGDISAQIETKLLYKFFQHLHQKLQDYKNSHIEKNFSDMLTYFYHALHGENGAALAAKIRQQFRFAMIDESQDTDQTQYRIFKRIFLDLPAGEPQHGFILIGDPKQSIYKFRGADIFSYLDAATQVAETYTLDKNWRSLPPVVETVNQLFAVEKPFLYEQIQFQPVKFKQSDEQLLNGQQAINFYLLENAYIERGAHWRSDLAAEHCAEQIAQQLNAAQQGEPFVQQGEQPRSLEPQDIAILVRSHNEAAQIKRSLSARNLQSVYLSERDSVYQTQEAADLALILKACLNPFSAKALLAALGSSLWGLTAAQIFQLKNNENEWETYVEQFAAALQIWQTQGVLPMLHQLFIQQGIIARLNGGSNADRRITNILHLAELLQAKMETVENESSLLRWLQQQIAQPSGDSDEQVLRLESDANLIKIITIHKSKGLEYPVVWLPFIAKRSKGAESAAMSTYRDEQNQVQWDFNSRDEAIKSLKNQAEYAEDLRLLYVALTRAKYQLHLILPQKWSSSWNAMGYLLANGAAIKDLNSEQALADKGISGNKIFLNEPPTLTLFEAAEQQDLDVVAAEFHGTIRETGSVTSFTALQNQHDYLQNFAQNRPLATLDDAQDYDRTSAPALAEFEQPNERSPFQFPHSTKVGNLLHRFFELQPFGEPLEREKIQQLCEDLALDESWIEPVQQWFERILHTPFGDQPFSLSQISPHKRLNEWQFYLRLSNPKALPQLDSLLKQHSPLAKNLPDLKLLQLDGFVKGFIDCIVEVGGKFYVIDYKSNFLGYLPQDYSAEKIIKTLGQYRYDLQFLLYTLAVHRYLRSRLGENYRYARDFGGVAYLFLRAMDGSPNSGVYFEKPSEALIEGMDELFG